MKVRQFDVKNQFIITNDGITYFQSYDTIIVKQQNGQITLDEHYWDYSKTTVKYRNRFLGDTKKDTQRKIDSGEYKLANLN